MEKPIAVCCMITCALTVNCLPLLLPSLFTLQNMQLTLLYLRTHDLSSSILCIIFVLTLHGLWYEVCENIQCVLCICITSYYSYGMPCSVKGVLHYILFSCSCSNLCSTLFSLHVFNELCMYCNYSTVCLWHILSS